MNASNFTGKINEKRATRKSDIRALLQRNVSAEVANFSISIYKNISFFYQFTELETIVISTEKSPLQAKRAVKKNRSTNSKTRILLRVHQKFKRGRFEIAVHHRDKNCCCCCCCEGVITRGGTLHTRVRVKSSPIYIYVVESVEGTKSIYKTRFAIVFR